MSCWTRTSGRDGAASAGSPDRRSAAWAADGQNATTASAIMMALTGVIPNIPRGGGHRAYDKTGARPKGQPQRTMPFPTLPSPERRPIMNRA